MSNEIDPFVMGVLGGFYKPETIMTRTFIEVGDPRDNSFKAGIIFPAYDRMLVPIDHVSGAQMYTALFEVGYLATARAIQNRTLSTPFSFEEFIEREDRVIATEITKLKYKKWLQVGELAELLLKVSGYRQRSGKCMLNLQFQGFIQGSVRGIMKLDDLKS
jgi:hypothetical protein